jgi:NAD(P)H dehydrogenase (quinone)
VADRRAGRQGGDRVHQRVQPARRNESTILALYNTMYHWGAIIVPPGYTDPIVFAAGGNPYGTAAHGNPTDEHVLAAARYQGRRLATIAGRLVNVRTAGR